MSLIYLETPRFIIRQWTLGDAGDLFRIMREPLVHRYTGDAPWSEERAVRYIRLMLEKDFRTLEIFHGACILKSAMELIGFSGLNPYLDQQPELEWQFGAPYWGKGYATEIGKSVTAAAFATTGIRSIFGMVNPQNRASMRVMEKIGMTCLGLREFRGEEDMFYQMDRPRSVLAEP
jgi:[ribosomal protein S5]-alanine N-acetyltransferase